MRDAGVSTLKLEMVCGLRLSKSRKSSFFKFSTTLPLSSRTTTRTKTMFTRTLKVVAESRVTTSAVAGGAAALSGPFVAGRPGLSWPAGVCAESGQKKEDKENRRSAKARQRWSKILRQERGCWRMFPSQSHRPSGLDAVQLSSPRISWRSYDRATLRRGEDGCQSGRGGLRLDSASAFQAAPRKIITADSCIQMSSPMTAARPP